MEINSEKIKLKIQCTNKTFEIKSAIVLESLNLPIQSLNKRVIEKITIESGIVDLDIYENAKPQILIGQDNWELIITREYLRVKNSNMVISRCLLGWVIHGPSDRSKITNHENTYVINEKQGAIENYDNKVNEDTIDNMMKEFFDIENIGVKINMREENDYDYIEELLKKTSVFKKNYWETGLLWKRERKPEIDGYATARKRLNLLEKRLDRDPDYARLYYGEMNRLIEQGYAKEINTDDNTLRKWYLPHFGVVNANKPGKVRLVFDAAAKSQNISFNDQLESGPDLLKSLPGILIRFRRYTVAFKGDIKDMFLRVRVQEKDQNAQMFLYRGKDRNKIPTKYKMTRLIFGAKSSPCSAIYIKNINAKRFEDQFPEAANGLINNCYMDDFISSEKCELKAEKIIKAVIEINEQADFKMHSWASNKSRILKNIERNVIAKTSGINLASTTRERVLGLEWDETEDILKFNLSFKKIKQSIINGSCVPTKREVLSVIMSVFDPLGLLAPYILKSKLLMQAIWKSKIKWDQELQKDEFDDWKNWLKSIEKIREVKVPRCMMPGYRDDEQAELHIFCDASKRAYGAVAYLRTTNETGEINISLIMSKGRVAPKKEQTIPRLELQAALLGANLSNYIESQIEIKLKQKYYWSDSMAVIYWIRGEPRTRKIFVENRLIEIRNKTKIEDWRWTSTSTNPADHMTRIDRNISKKENAWFDGPNFLKKTKTEWPSEQEISLKEKNHIDKLEKRINEVTVNFAAILNEKFSLSTRLLGWNGLLNVARRIRKFFYKWQIKTLQEDNYTITQKKNENFWIRDAQFDTYEVEIKELKRGKKIPKNSKIISLNPFLDADKFLRVNGRASNIQDEEFENFPIILDGNHIVARLLLKQQHMRYFHGSNETIINEIRQKFHITKIREKLKSLSSRCVGCKLRRGKPIEPLMSALPSSRLAYRERPFTHCGIDYFGPIMIKIGRRHEKRWGVLGTCMTTRAIHLELACSLTAGSAIMAVQRLAARRGTPQFIYSDNGTNFRAASKELKQAITKLNKKDLESRAKMKGIQWKFNPPQAPHMGGAWERLIRSVKTALKSVLNEQVTTEEILYTTLTEIEHCVNSRPLTHVSVDPRDREALTPNHFLIGCSSGEVTLEKFNDNEICLRKQWRISQKLADNFWRRWLREYLPTLLERKKWNQSIEPIMLGDLVLIMDFQLPRNMWSKGIVIRVMPSKDKQIRVAEIDTPHGTVVRPVHKLITLVKNVGVQN